MNQGRPSASLLAKFRSDRRRLPLHPWEKAVLAVVAVHLCFLPWALGAMSAWSQVTSLGLALAGFGLALVPRRYTAEQSGGPAMRLTMWPRLLKFPLFWIGLALLAYIAVQGFNPSWVYTQNDRQWWLIRVNDTPWLPTSIETPFERFNLWRQFIIYTSAWLTVCTIWTGFTRSRSLRILLILLAGNAALLGMEGFAMPHLVPYRTLGLVPRTPDTIPFASFIYKNHAGAYFSLLAFVPFAIAAWMYDNGERNLTRKSTPIGLFAMAAVFLAGTVLFTNSRGASAILTIVGTVALGWFVCHLKFRPSQDASTKATMAVILVFLAALVCTARYMDVSRIYGRIDRLIKDQSLDESARLRLQAYDAGDTMLQDYWLRGVGAGGFRYYFPEYLKKYPDAYQNGTFFWEHAHRDWLEIPIELGAAGSLLLLSGGAYWLVFFVRRRVAWHPLVMPLLLGCSQTLMHAWFDFPMQSPAILITWLALLALAARQTELDAAQ